MTEGSAQEAMLLGVGGWELAFRFKDPQLRSCAPLPTSTPVAAVPQELC